LKLAARGGKNAKKRAVVAVARKLAVLLHHLWLTHEAYVPLRPQKAKPHEISPGTAPSSSLRSPEGEQPKNEETVKE
jgi:hypothetical protein